MTKDNTITNLTTQAPRSPRVQLGGYAILPRLLDKCRADIQGQIGEYHTNCAIDQEFLTFAGIDYDELRAQLEQGKKDGEILQWVHDNSSTKPTPWQIRSWSEYQNERQPEMNTGYFDYFQMTLNAINPARTDVKTWCDLLDLDDYVSFGALA
jgi:hypothetical protein